MKDEKLKRIKEIAASVRSEIKRIARMKDGWYYLDRYDLGGGCGIASYLLHEVLRKRGFKTTLVYGEFEGGNHFWIQYGDQIIDITHTQFSLEAPRVALFPKDTEGFNRITWYSKEAKQELRQWESYKDTKKHLDKAEKRLLRKYKRTK